MENQCLEYELNLNWITTIEQLQYSDTFSIYQKEVTLLLNLKHQILNKSQVITLFNLENKTKDNLNIETILLQYPHFIKLGKQLKNKINSQTSNLETVSYINLAAEYLINPTDFYYDKFFIRKLRQINTINMFDFLYYHLEKNDKSDSKRFILFVKLALQKHQVELLTPELTQTVNEVLSFIESRQVNPSNETPTQITKRKIKRDANDKLTVLNLEQTVLFISYLQKERFILPNEYLSDKTIAEAFELLTGYSPHTIRQSLGKYPNFINKSNSKELDLLIEKIKTANQKQ